MDKKLSIFFRYNKVKDKNGTEYKVQIGHQGQEYDIVPAVKCEDEWEYDKLNLARQQRELTAEEEIRLKELEVMLPVKDIESADFVRFITPKYKSKFIIRNLDKVLYKGERYIVAGYGDDYHMSLYRIKEDGSFGYGGLYHICEFAEMCERTGATVEPLGQVFDERGREIAYEG